MKNYTQKKAPIKPPEDNFCAKDKRCGFISEKPGLERESTQNRAERPVSKRFRHVVLLSFERAVMDVMEGCTRVVLKRTGAEIPLRVQPDNYGHLSRVFTCATRQVKEHECKNTEGLHKK